MRFPIRKIWTCGSKWMGTASRTAIRAQLIKISALADAYRVPVVPHGSSVHSYHFAVTRHNSADPLAEAQWLQALADEPANNGHPHGIVAYADLSNTDAPVLLERLASCRNVRGIRQILNVHTDPRYDYVGRHYLRGTAVA